MSKLYCNDSLVLVFSSFVMAAAIKKWGIDRKLALWVVDYVGPQPKGLMAAFMALTLGIGLFMPNTSTARCGEPLPPRPSAPTTRVPMVSPNDQPNPSQRRQNESGKRRNFENFQMPNQPKKNRKFGGFRGAHGGGRLRGSWDANYPYPPPPPPHHHPELPHLDPPPPPPTLPEPPLPPPPPRPLLYPPPIRPP